MFEGEEVIKNIFASINEDRIFEPIAEEAFRAIDKDKNGLIDKDEFRKCAIQVAESFGLEEPDQSNIDETYNQLDLDSNGYIDLHEFKNYIKKIILSILGRM